MSLRFSVVAPVVAGMIHIAATDGAVAAVLCAPKSGAGPVSVRAACGRNQVQLDPAALGLQGPPGERGPAGAPGPTAAILVDSTGTKVGDVVGIDPMSPDPPGPNVTIVTTVNNQSMLLTANFYGFGGNSPADNREGIGTSTVFFSERDCAGTAYILAGGVRGPLLVLWPRIVTLHGRYAYIPQSTTLENLITRSALIEPVPKGAPGLEDCVLVNEPITDAMPASVIDLFSLFTPPFTVRAP